MNRVAASVALATCCVGGAFAQSTVTVYGVVDTGVEHVTNVGAARAGMTRMPGLTGLSPSRLGFRGTEDLGGGLRALFTLEMGFSVDDGTLGQGGRSFGRQAFVGLGGRWGTLSLGRQYTMNFWALGEADIIGPSAHGLGAIDSYIPNARADNSIAYRGTFGKVTVGGLYSVGRDTVNASGPAGTNCPGESSADKKACRATSFMLRFDDPSWGVAASYDRINGGSGAFAGLSTSSRSDTRTQLNGYARLGTVKIGGGVLRRDNEGSPATPRSDLWHAGASWKVTPAVSLDGALHYIAFRNSANGARRLSARAVYSLSRRTDVYASVSHIENEGTSAFSVTAGAPGANPAAGGSQSGAMVGLRHVF